MRTNSTKKDHSKRRTDVFKEAGSSRVVASASWTILMAIIGAIMLFIYQVIAGNYYGESGGLSYFSVAGSILALAAALSVGCGQAFIKIAKEKYTMDGIEKGKSYIIQMSKINMILGLIMTIIVFIIAFININDPVFFIILLGAASAVLISYIRDNLTNMMGTLNRFDFSSIIGGIYGVVVFIFGFMIILLKLPAQFLSFVPAIMILLMVILAIYFYNKIKTVGFKELFLSFKRYPINKKFAKKYLIYGSECTISNFVVFGIYSHIVLLMTFVMYNYFGFIFNPEAGVLTLTQILTLVDSFIFIEVALIFFSGPLNVEVSEANAKNDLPTMEKSINIVGRIALIIAIPISLAMVILAPNLILLFARGSVSVGNPPILSNSLFLQAWLTLAITSFGQAFYGLACIFGSALIGAGHARKAAIGFGLGALILFATTPAFILAMGMMDNYLPILGITPYSLIGAGFSFLASGIFILPYLAIKAKKTLKINYDLRVKRMLPCVAILAIFLIFTPTQNLILLIIYLLGGTLLNTIILCFFGVLGAGDGKIIKDTLISFKLGFLAGFLIKFGKLFYNLNPLNKK